MNTRKNPLWMRLLCAALVLCTLVLCACPGEIPSGGGSSTTSTTGSGGGGGTPPINPPVYGEGAAIADAGDRMAASNPSLVAPTYDEAGATAADARLISMLLPSGSLTATAYRVSEATPVTFSGATEGVYDANGAVLLLTGGFLLRDCSNMTLTNLVIVGSLTLEGCENVTLENVKVINPSGVALTVDDASSNIEVNACRLDGRGAIANASSNFSLRASYLAFAAGGLIDDGAFGTVVRDCRFVGAGTALTTSADEANIMYNTFELTADSVGIEIKGEEGEYTQNAIAALNTIRGAQTGARAEWAFNSVVLLNSLISVEAHSSKNLYIVENSLGGRIVAKNNNYIIADCNSYPDDGKNHATLAVANQNTNGDGLTDLTARPDAGANPDLLPHINKDQFLGMTRKDNVTDLDSGESTPIHEYVLKKAKTNDYIIIAPGAYNSPKPWSFDVSCSNTTIYAYGVLAERPIGRDQRQIYIGGVTNFTIKGLTCTYAESTSTVFQAYIVEKKKLPGSVYQFKIRPGAGFIEDFGQGNPSEAFDWMKFSPWRAGEEYPFHTDMGYISVSPEPDANGLLTMTVGPTWYSMLEVGDRMTARMSGSRQITVAGSTDITFYDLTHYAHTGGFSFELQMCNGDQNFYRTVVTTRARSVITEQEYKEYRAMEQQYGISFDMDVDEEGNYRGSLPLVSGLDAAHIISSEKGGTMEYCIFENMDDDGTNQRHEQARLHALVDNGDGTTTIIFKGNMSNQGYNKNGPNYANRFPRSFRKGDRVLVYTAEGELVCDAAVLGDQQAAGTTTDWENLKIVGPIEMRSVLVPTESVRFEATEGYDLNSNHYDWSTKICVDNMNFSCSGTYFDNCLIQNLRSRGLLIKSSDVIVKNCTLRNIAMAGIGLIEEKLWGESGVTQNAKIQNNLLDNAGHAPILDFAAVEHNQVFIPIAICGYGSIAKEEYCLYKNIEITGNVIKNRNQNNYAVLIKGAQNVLIEGNDFGTIYEGDDPNGTSIWLEGALNVKIENNLYPPTASGDWMEGIRDNGVCHIYGADVEFNGIPLIEDSIYPDPEE